MWSSDLLCSNRACAPSISLILQTLQLNVNKLLTFDRTLRLYTFTVLSAVTTVSISRFFSKIPSIYRDFKTEQNKIYNLSSKNIIIRLPWPHPLLCNYNSLDLIAVATVVVIAELALKVSNWFNFTICVTSTCSCSFHEHTLSTSPGEASVSSVVRAS